MSFIEKLGLGRLACIPLPLLVWFYAERLVSKPETSHLKVTTPKFSRPKLKTIFKIFISYEINIARE